MLGLDCGTVVGLVVPAHVFALGVILVLVYFPEYSSRCLSALMAACQSFDRVNMPQFHLPMML